MKYSFQIIKYFSQESGQIYHSNRLERNRNAMAIRPVRYRCQEHFHLVIKLHCTQTAQVVKVVKPATVTIQVA